ncbi:MAG: glycerol-3-phosphate ABC transporter ATP-binding protein [Opitutae bacterium]|nr:glycerol-3-phosphate ABC transporter ATP-binding protein [Opitutae bacterium]|tara:strand:+ start:4146 stop:5264 length:1119 start_codon:yes stop_codon:yes gene_type:complete
MATVEFRKAGKTFSGDIRAMDEFDLSVKDGEFITLVGPSGCGKTTALRALAGLESLTDGEILIDDKAMNTVAPGDRDISMVFQNYALFPHLNVFENMAFGLRARNFPKPEVNRMVHEVADRLGLSDLLNRKPAALSGGQRQRVALGRAIARKPKVYLLDEPLSNLDAQLRLTMRKELSILRQELGVTTLYVTHDQEEALTLGDRVCVLNKGRIQQVGTPQETYDSPANRFVASFLGSPPMNFLRGDLRRAENGYSFKQGDLNVPLPKTFLGENLDASSSAGELGIRPEHFILGQPAKAEGSIQLHGELEHKEWQGDQVLLYLKGNFGEVIAKTKVSEVPKVSPGDKLTIWAPLAGCHFFDASTQQNLSLHQQ